MRPLFILLLVLFSFCCKANEIDNLKTIDDVKAFLKSKLKDTSNVNFFETTKNDAGEKMAQTRFIKIDLNADGLTDLLINGTYLFAMIDNGKGDFEPLFIDKGAFMFRKYILADIDTSQKQPKIIVKLNPRKYPGDTTVKNFSYDTLIVKYNGFVEFNNTPGKDEIKKVSISTTACFGTCPIFNLVVASNGYALYNAIDYNKIKGNFECEIDKKTLGNIFSLVNYIHVKTLKDKYAVNWTDDQTIELKVTYKNGFVKKISDYGLIGTFGLQRLYETLFDLRESLNWE